MAAPKSSSRKTAAKKKSAKTAKSGNIARKAKKPAKRPAAGKKKVAKKKVSAPRKKRPTTVVAAASPAVVELDQRIAIVRNNLRDLTEIAAASSGASNEELVSGRIADQEEQLRALIKQRDDLVRREG